MFASNRGARVRDRLEQRPSRLQLDFERLPGDHIDATRARRTFLRRFASATGQTPIEYCRAVRIARARELLEGSNVPLKVIADNLGYGDVSAFAKAFRRTYGVPPGTHRRRHGGAIAPGNMNDAAAAADC